MLRGVGEAIRKSPAARTKILILNGSLDREVGPRREPFTALDFVEAIVRAGEESRGVAWRKNSSRSRSPLFQNEESAPVPTAAVNGVTTSPGLDSPLHSKTIYSSYITHLIYLTGPQTPHVDPPLLRSLGIDTLKLYGRKIEDVGPNGEVVVKGMKYDPVALGGALETILGRKGAAMIGCGDEGIEKGEGPGRGIGFGMKSRRNTLEG